jgi:hypothetical protein
MKKRFSERTRRLFGWWYVAIGAGFILLGIQRQMLGEGAGALLLRWAIAAGFLVLGAGTLRSPKL